MLISYNGLRALQTKIRLFFIIFCIFQPDILKIKITKFNEIFILEIQAYLYQNELSTTFNLVIQTHSQKRQYFKMTFLQLLF